MKKYKVIYRTKIREEYDWLMQELEKEGCNWLCGNKPTERDMFGPFASETTFLWSIKNSHVELVRTTDSFKKVIIISKYQT